LFEENRVKKSRRSSGEGCDDASRSTDRDTSSSLGQLQHVKNICASCGCEQRV